jgi:hypothetical protein
MKLQMNLKIFKKLSIGIKKLLIVTMKLQKKKTVKKLNQQGYYAKNDEQGIVYS